MIPNPNIQRIRAYGAAVMAVLAGSAAGAADYPTTVQAHNPVAYWRFDETVASPAPAVAANSTALGSAANGYVGLSVDQGEPGIVGSSVRVHNDSNTVGYVGGRIDVPNLGVLNPKPPFSVEFWAKANSLGTDSTGFAPITSVNSDFYAANRSGWIFYLNNAGRWQFRVGGENSYTAVATPTTGFTATNVWNHVVGVFDGTTSKLYVNGVQVATASASASAPYNPNKWTPLRIGGTTLTGGNAGGTITYPSPAGNRGFDGWVDEVAVYTNILSDAAIAAHFSAASTNNAGYHAQILADNPVGYWGLDEPAYVQPDPSTFPAVVNSGSLGTDADGTNTLGVLAAQSGAPFAGLGTTNRAVWFGGESGQLLLNSPTALTNAVQPGQPLTLAAWIKPTQAGGVQDIIAQGFDSNFAETYLRIGDTVDWEGTGSPNTAYYEIGSYDGGTGPYLTAAYPVPAGDIGNWVFLAGTWDGSNWNLYRNGQLVASTADEFGPNAVDSGWSVGSRSGPFSSTDAFDTSGFNFHGLIDEPAIFTNALSADAILALYQAAQVSPVITLAPQLPSGPVYEGATVSFSVWAEGNPTLSYQWTKDGAPLGNTTTNLTLNSVTKASSGLYAVIVSNSYGSATSSVPLTVLALPPSVTQQPVSETRWAGSPFGFTVGAVGSAPLSYQWSFGGVPIADATASGYSSIASAARAGSYSVAVTNPAGVTNSASATLTVLTPPAGYISTILADNPIAYWRLDETNGTVAHDYAGGNDGTYNNVTLGQAGYSVLDSDPAATFSGASGSYVGNISGTSINFEGTNNLSFSVEAWANGGADQTDGAALVAKGTGSNGGSANEQFVLGVNAGVYRFFVRDPKGNIAEADASVGPDGIWHHIVGVYDGVGGQLYIYVDGEQSGSASVPAAGVRASSYGVSIGAERSGVAPDYDWAYNGSIDEVAIYGSALSQTQIANHFAAVYGAKQSPLIALQPAPATNYIGFPVTLSTYAVGTQPIAYQWQKGGQPIQGANTATYAIAALQAGDVGDYSVVVSNAAGTTNSATAHVTVLSAPTTPVQISDLVLHLPFDGNLTDATGRGNNGTAVGAPTFTDGKVGSGSLHYSTDTSDTDKTKWTFNYVKLGVLPDLQFGTNTDFSVGFWIRLPLNYAGGDLPFIGNVSGSTFGTGWVLTTTYGSSTANLPGGWAYSFFDSGGNGIGVYGDAGSINDGGWHHLVYVFDRKKGATVYLDGTPAHPNRQSGTTAADAKNVDTSLPITIGQDPTGTYDPGNEADAEDIDDLGIWRKALTALEVEALYTAASVNGVSFAPAATAVTVTFKTTADGHLVITYPSGTLQSSGTVNGTYAPVSGATSPYTVLPSGGAQFYRVVN